MAKSKRQKKKQTRKQQVRALTSVGYSEKQVKRMATAERKTKSKPIITKKKRSDSAKRSYESREKFIKKYGLTNVSKTDSWETIQNRKAAQEKERETIKRRMAAKRSYDERKEFIELHNLTGVKSGSSWKDIRTAYFHKLGIQDVPPEWVKSEKAFAKMSRIENIPFTAEDWLYIGYGDPSGNINVRHTFAFYENESLSFYDNTIQENLPRKDEPPEQSSGRPGNTVLLRGEYERVRDFMRYHEDRGYQTICFSNEWSLYGLKRVEAITMDLSTSSNIKVIETGIRNYVRVNIPALKDFF